VIGIFDDDLFDAAGPVIRLSADFGPIDAARAMATRAILDGLEALAAFGDSLDASAVMQTVIPLLDFRLADEVSAGDLIRTRIVVPVEELLETIATPTPREVADALRSAIGALGDTMFDLPGFGASGNAALPDIRLTLGGGEFEVSIDLDGLDDVGALLARIRDQVRAALPGPLALTFDVRLDTSAGNRLEFLFERTDNGDRSVEIQASHGSALGELLGLVRDGVDALLPGGDGRFLGRSLDLGVREGLFRLSAGSLLGYLNGRVAGSRQRRCAKVSEFPRGITVVYLLVED